MKRVCYALIIMLIVLMSSINITASESNYLTTYNDYNLNTYDLTYTLDNDIFFGNLKVIECGDVNIPEPLPPITRLIVTFLKIATPLILIIMGMIDMIKAVTSNDEKKLKEAQATFFKRLIPGVAIFLVITVFQFLIGILADNAKEGETLAKCIDCMISDSSKCGAVSEGTSSSGSSSGSGSAGSSSSGGGKLVTSSKDITFTYNYFENGPMPYGLFTPSSAKSNKKTPLIIWLHGNNERYVDKETFKKSGLLNVLLSDWKTKNKEALQYFNAYVLCPHWTGDEGWNSETARTQLNALIKYIKSKKNILESKIIIVGHSLGGQGTLYMAAKDNFYSAAVILSGYSPGTDINKIKLPIKGYVGKPSSGEHEPSYNYMSGTFKSVFGKDNLFILNTAHGYVPKVAFTADENNDHKSDLIEWMLAQ